MAVGRSRRWLGACRTSTRRPNRDAGLQRFSKLAMESLEDRLLLDGATSGLPRIVHVWPLPPDGCVLAHAVVGELNITVSEELEQSGEMGSIPGFVQCDGISIACQQKLARTGSAKSRCDLSLRLQLSCN